MENESSIIFQAVENIYANNVKKNPRFSREDAMNYLLNLTIKDKDRGLTLDEAARQLLVIENQNNIAREKLANQTNRENDFDIPNFMQKTLKERHQEYIIIAQQKTRQGNLDEQTFQRINRTKENIVKNSILPASKKGKRKYAVKYPKKLAFALLISIAITVCGIKYVAPKVAIQIIQNDIKKDKAFEGNQILAENNMYAAPDYNEDTKDYYWNNDYNKIPDLNENHILPIYYYCGVDEAEKVIQALGYKDWNNFLSMKGMFADNGNGSPSIEVWENYALADLIEVRNTQKRMGN